MAAEILSKIPFIALAAECGGTAVLLFLGCLGCLPSLFPAQGAIAFGGALTTAIQIFGHISGGHFNPAISLSAFAYGAISLPVALMYSLAQLLGGVAGYALALYMTPKHLGLRDPGSTFCNTIPDQDLTTVEHFFLEYISTFILILICCSVWDKRNEGRLDSVALKFGLFIIVVALAVGPLSGGSFNPARTFGPSIINDNWDTHWLYWVAPIAGGISAALLYRFLFGVNDSDGPGRRSRA